MAGQPVGELSEGDGFGEMGLLTGGTRAATITVVSADADVLFDERARLPGHARGGARLRLGRVDDGGQPAPGSSARGAGTSLSSPEKIRELLDVIQSVSQELNLDKLLQRIMERTSTIMSADRSTLFLVDRERGELWSKIAQGIDLQEIRVPLGQGIAGVVATGETVNITDAHARSPLQPGRRPPDRLPDPHDPVPAGA